MSDLNDAVKNATLHQIVQGDARNLGSIASESVHLVCSSPPYADLIHYSDHPDQLGGIDDYESFLVEMDKVLEELSRVLIPGGRIAFVVGDVCVSRRAGGRHHVLPLAADLQSRSRRFGLDNLTPIRWLKVANVKMEASRSSRFLGKPNLPNGVIKNDIETIIFLRKKGYRKPTPEMENLSRIPTDEYVKLFAPIWTDVKGQLRRDHPAPYPVEIPARLIRMFSFVGDTVLDPFAGTGTTAFAAGALGRNSINVEIEERYVALMRARLQRAKLQLSGDLQLAKLAAE
ncbi:MAG: site-specific DNA-methyltransferase [Rhodobacteraceae bacterium]|nr:MAG: site-specific DNA-methyltransferase [Paracoccaceae bacterium]